MNLAVFLPNWIGDAVTATPALRALRQHFHAARLIGVVKPYVAGVLEGGDWFDQIILAHDGSWSQGSTATAWKLRRLKIDHLAPRPFADLTAVALDRQSAVDALPTQLRALLEWLQYSMSLLGR